ncbi:MAG: carboxypeptidase regulatory-like domain-containing protein [bacterium]|nr:carboxypeptidase regulatory-like domain-containing protein [bacterium]
MSRLSRARLAPTAGLLFASLIAGADADTISGRVVDANGVGVSGVDLDVFEQNSGNEVPVTNGASGAGGIFNALIAAPGVYRVVFKPPAPPVTTHLIVQVENVVVVGMANMGDVALPAGVALSGRAVRAGGTPVPGVDLDLYDASGTELMLQGDQTDANGNFVLAAPFGAVELQFDTSTVPSPLLAPERRELDLSGNTNIGNVQLELGYVLSATVRRTSGTPVSNADLDVVDIATGDERFTPGDNTNGSGFVDVVVPAGTWDVEVCPPFADRLLGRVLRVTISSTTNLGNVTLQPGFVLSGQVRDGNGSPIVNVDLDVIRAGLEVTLCGDNTDAAGNYAVIVPSGNLDLIYTPPYELPFGSLTIPDRPVGGDASESVVLPDCPCAAPMGVATPGTGGIAPVLTANGGCMRIGNPDWAVTLSQGRGGAAGALFFNLGQLNAPRGLAGQTGAQLIAPLATVPFTLNGAAGAAGAGSYSRGFPLPADPQLAGLSLSASAIVFDPAAPAGRAVPIPVMGVLCR